LDPLTAAILGVLQGLTEFLPVSSSGHLVLAEAFLGVEAPGATFEIFAHAGTLVAILVYFRRDIGAMAVSCATLRRDEHTKAALLILLGSVPAAAVGLGLRDHIEPLFDLPVLAACMLLVTAGILFATRLIPRGRREVGPGTAIAMGVAQAIAILPGISRSGSTIAAGMAAGADKEKVARFSFLLVIPALAGATALELAKGPEMEALAPSLIGAATAFVSGILALHLLLRVVARGRLDRFGWYCLAVGLGALAALMIWPHA